MTEPSNNKVIRMGKTVAWWSAGVTSAVACKIAIDELGADNVDLIYFKIDSAHSDNDRFMHECEKWYGKKVEIYRSNKYDDQFDVIEQTGFINGPYGAKCTSELKKNVRLRIQRERDYERQVFGFEYSRKEINRSLRFQEQYPNTNPWFPLIEQHLTKPDCLKIITNEGIRPPKMYELGYPNNNCVGCVKGGMGYWNKIRDDFPDVFNRMARLEREVGASCINGCYLDELTPDRGRLQSLEMPDCGSLCDIKYADIPHPALPADWLTLYCNESTLPVAASWQGDPSVLGEPTIVTDGVRIWNIGDDLHLLATLDPLVTDVTYSPNTDTVETDND